jgi:hypothetical protein
MHDARESGEMSMGSLLSLVMSCALVIPVAPDTTAPLRGLPAGARSRWAVEQPEEIVTYLVFDPATVRSRLPAGLRFITLEELARGGVGWAGDIVHRYPARSGWGVSFLEIVRAGTFVIDEREPSWPADGAAALWFARVAPSDSSLVPGPGRPLLALDLWIPDRDYAAYMRERGYPAEWAQVTLRAGPHGSWSGKVKTDGLEITTECVPAGPIGGGEDSAGAQVIFPPATSTVTGLVRIAFAGHRVQDCDPSSWWRIRGSHPLARAVPVGASSFEYGYHLWGGSYPR